MRPPPQIQLLSSMTAVITISALGIEANPQTFAAQVDTIYLIHYRQDASVAIELNYRFDDRNCCEVHS
jgi:hypothetical protein